MKQYNETVPPGKSPTNLMISAALTDSYRYKLMFNTVNAVPNAIYYRQIQRYPSLSDMFARTVSSSFPHPSSSTLGVEFGCILIKWIVKLNHSHIFKTLMKSRQFEEH